MPSTALTVTRSTDRELPTKYAGKLEPNFWCRGWNAKREKYCGAPAGKGTEHPGVGRCKHHGGRQEDDARVTTLRYAKVASPRIQELLQELESDPDPLNVVSDLNLARALLIDFVSRASSGATAQVPEKRVLDGFLEKIASATKTTAGDLEDARKAVDSLAAVRSLPDIAEAVRLLDVVSKIVHRVEMLKTAGAVSLDQVRRFLAAVDRELQHHVDDETLREKLRKAFYSIRV